MADSNVNILPCGDNSTKRCFVPLSDVRKLLPLSDNSINITEIASILLTTGDKFIHSGSTSSLKKKQHNSSLKEKIPVEKRKKRIVETLSDSEEKSVESDSGDEESDDSGYFIPIRSNKEKRENRKQKEQKEKNAKYKEKREDRKQKEQKEKNAKYKEKREDGKNEEHEEKKAKYEKDESESDFEERSEGSNSDSQEEDESVSDYEKSNMSSYEKLIEKKRKENVEFLESLEIDKVKGDFSKQVKKDRKSFSKIEYPPASRKSKRTANVILDYSEEKLLRDVWGKVKRDILYADNLTRPGKRSKRLADKDYDFSEFFE